MMIITVTRPIGRVTWKPSRYHSSRSPEVSTPREGSTSREDSHAKHSIVVANAADLNVGGDRSGLRKHGRGAISGNTNSDQAKADCLCCSQQGDLSQVRRRDRDHAAP